MSKKTNDKTIDLLYVKPKKNNNKTTNKNKSKPKNSNIPKKVQKNNIINLDDEVIIGLTPKKVQKELKKENIKKNTNKKQSPKQVKSNTKQKTIKKNKAKTKILKWTSILILLTGAVILFMLSPIFNIKQINVEGTKVILQEEIIGLSQIQLNENTFKIKLSEVKERIKNNTYIETVSINRELPSTIKITIKEREPQCIIQIANGNAYIDSTGHILEISTESLPLPILNGYETPIENIIDYQNTKKLSDEDCKKIEVISQIIEAARNNDILSYITSIDMTDITDIKLNLDSEKKVAYLGDGSDTNMRILYLKKIIEEEKDKEGEAFINGDLHTMKPKPYFREKV